MEKFRLSQIFTREVEGAVAAKKGLDEGAPFAELVQQYSECPSKKQGGDLGWMDEQAAGAFMGPQFQDKKVGAVIGPIHSQYGYHLLMVTDIKDESAALKKGPFQTGTAMTEVQETYPDSGRALFEKFQIGLPLNGYKPEETLQSISETHGKSPQEVTEFLNLEYNTKFVATITPEELHEKLKSSDANGLSLLDIREKWEHDIVFIREAQLITKQNCEDILNSLDKESEVVLLDWKEDRGPSFKTWLGQRGFTNVKCLKGGIDAWAEKIDTRLSRYDIDSDDDYRYEDIV